MFYGEFCLGLKGGCIRERSERNTLGVHGVREPMWQPGGSLWKLLRFSCWENHSWFLRVFSAPLSNYASWCYYGQHRRFILRNCQSESLHTTITNWFGKSCGNFKLLGIFDWGRGWFCWRDDDAESVITLREVQSLPAWAPVGKLFSASWGSKTKLKFLNY